MNKTTFATYITNVINIQGVSQVEIAAACGWAKPNMVTMIKQGKSKMPINKIPALAKVLGVDPMRMLRIALEEYQPELMSTIDAVAGLNEGVSPEEKRVINAIRDTYKEQEWELSSFSNEAVEGIKAVVEASIQKEKRFASA